MIENSKTNRRLILGLSVLLLFIILSSISLFVVRKKILNNVQVMGKEISSHLLLEEAKRIDNYEIFLKIASTWLNTLIDRKASSDEIKDWFKNYRNYMGNELNSESVELYSAIDKKIIGATYWEGNKTLNLNERVWYTKAIEGNGKVVYTDLYKDARTGENTFTISLKLNDKNDVLAVDIYTKDLMKFSDKLAFNSLYEDNFYYLCDSQGNLIYMKSRISDDLDEIQAYIKNIFNDIKSGKYESSSSFTYDLKNIKRGVYYSYSEDGWVSIVTIPYSVLLSEMMGLYYLYLGSIIFVLVVGFFLYRRESKINKIVEETNDTIRVLGNSYYGIYRINFSKKTYSMIKGSDYIRSQISSKGNYEDLESKLCEVIEEDSKEEFKKAFSIENMEKLVKNRVRDFGGDFKRALGTEYRWANIRLLFDESLNPNEIILCFKDIDTEKKKSLEYTELLKTTLKSMEEKTHNKNIFFSSMSHDMRTPLNGIIGLSELAKNHLNNPDIIKEYLEKINASSKQLLNLINDILELSKIEFNKNEIVEEAFLLEEKLNEITDIFKLEAERTKKNFETKYEIENNFVKGDCCKLSQILNNLLSNAFKYTKENGSIILNIKELKREKKSNYSFEIIDTGCGMSQEFLERLYEPFERETRFGAKGISGTGLGMVIVKNLVAQLEGEIKVESELNKGTTINLIIPLEILGKTQEKEEKNIETSGNYQGKRILVVEDNEINMEIITELLTMKGLEVIQAWNGKEAVETFQKSNINELDMILMDMQMPIMNGCDATKEIRKLSREDANKIPIIAVTANAFAEDITATTMAGMNSHISKPIDFTILDKVLKKYLIK